MENRFRHFLIFAAVGLLLMVPVLLYLPMTPRTDPLDRIGRRQLLLTARTADHVSGLLNNLQRGLSHLAQDGETLLRDRRQASRKLARLASNHPVPLITVLYLKDHEGNLLAEHPEHRLGKLAFPTHLLNQLAFGTPRLILSGGRPFLLLAQPITDQNGQRAEISALIALDNLDALGVEPPGAESGFAFLIDESGRFLLHRNPALSGRDYSEVVRAERQPGLFALFSDMAHGKQGFRTFAGDVLADDPEPYRRTIVTYAPLLLAGTRLSLGLAHTPELPTTLDRKPALFIYASLLATIFISLLIFCNLRLWQRGHRVSARQSRLEAESAELRRALEQSEQRYRQVFDYAGDAIFFIDPQDGALQSINNRASELLGYTAAEIRTLSLNVLFPGRERRRYLRLVKRVLREGYGEESNLRFRRKDGKLFTGEVHVRLGRLGDTQAVHGVFRDVTDIRHIEKQLRRKNRDLTLVNEIAHRAAGSRELSEMLQAILGQVLETFEVDGGGIYLYRNEDGRLHLSVHQGIAEEVLPRIATRSPESGLLGRVLASGQPRTTADLQQDSRADTEVVRGAGWRGFQAIPLAANERTVGILFLFSQGKRTLSREEIRLLLAIGRQVGTSVESAGLFEALQWQHRLTRASNKELEISRQKLKENLEQLEEANRVLEGLDQMKSNFLALASHELRTPLTYILSSAELLREQTKGRLKAQEERLLDAIHLGGKRLQEIVRDLLEMTRLENRNLYLGRERINLGTLVEDVAKRFRPTLEERDLTLEVAPFRDATLIGDPDHLHRTLARLIENSVKFTPGGGVIEIRGTHRTAAEIRAMEPRLKPFSPLFFSRDPPAALLQLTIRDSGIGIEPEEHVRIFDKFYEVGGIEGHSTSRTRFGGKGVGIGLTLVKGMIEAHGGMVWVESPGSGETEMPGSSFNLLLPLADEETERIHATG